jgi:hypothetical protein
MHHAVITPLLADLKQVCFGKRAPAGCRHGKIITERLFDYQKPHSFATVRVGGCRFDRKVALYNPPMCYSAMVEQDLKSLGRRFNAQVDYASFDDMMRRRADGEAFNIGKALEANFYNPQSDAEMRIKAHIDRYNEQVGKQLETALFAQKKRLADAERTLATKETKKALEDKRIASNKIDWHLKKKPLLSELN